MNFIIEFWQFLKIRKKFWLLPIIIILLIFGGLFIVTQGTVFAPIIFIVLSNKACVLYHFNNAIFVWAFLFFTIYSIVVIKHFLTIELNIYICRVFFILITFLYCLNAYLEKESQLKIYN